MSNELFMLFYKKLCFKTIDTTNFFVLAEIKITF